MFDVHLGAAMFSNILCGSVGHLILAEICRINDNEKKGEEMGNNVKWQVNRVQQSKYRIKNKTRSTGNT